METKSFYKGNIKIKTYIKRNKWQSEKITDKWLVALLNNKSLSISNVSPKVGKMLDVTGLNKTFANVATNPMLRKSR